jgi:Spy/CpxP family protein refolding chaperone
MLPRIAVFAAVAAAALMAQPPGPPDAATMVQRRVSQLTTLLSLTDAQAAQATTIFTDAATASSTLQTDMGTARQSLHDAVKKNDTKTIDQAAATVGTLTGQLTAIQSKADAAFYAILTTDQQAKYDTLGWRGFGPGPGGPGGPGMGPMGFPRRRDQ